MRRLKLNEDDSGSIQKKFLFFWFTEKKLSAIKIKRLKETNFFKRKNITTT